MRKIIVLMSFLLLMGTNSFAGTYNYISPEQMKANMLSGTEQLIVDIQVEDAFAKHHLKGSVATFSYPVKAAAERAQIDDAIEMYKETNQPVVVVCPRGKGGAKRCYDYMASQNVPREKLFILEKGMDAWPYQELVEAN